MGYRFGRPATAPVVDSTIFQETAKYASILHECAFAGRMEQVVYLIGKGIDVTIKDHLNDGTAEDWARFAGQDGVAD